MSGACPIGCKYCHVSEVSYRRKAWQRKFLIGLNKTATVFNPPIDLEDKSALQTFYDFPLELFTGDIVGFNAITDPFWSKYRNELSFFLERVPNLAKSVVCVTKFPVTRKQMLILSSIPNFLLNVSITGLDMLEKTSTENRLKTLSLAKEYGVKAFPVIHPYIHGMTNLYFLKELKKLGYEEVDIKGFRYDPSMSSFLPKHVNAVYNSFTGIESFPYEGIIKENIKAAGIQIIPLRNWVNKQTSQEKSIPLELATSYVNQILSYANITSSASSKEVIIHCIRRRIYS